MEIGNWKATQGLNETFRAKTSDGPRVHVANGLCRNYDA